MAHLDKIIVSSKRGIESRLFYLETRASDTRGNKNAIGRLFERYTPDYVLIVGAPDVVPHLKVTNLANDEDGRIIDSDLPRAMQGSTATRGDSWRRPASWDGFRTSTAVAIRNT